MNNLVKERFLEALYANRSGNKITQVHTSEYRMRCHFCGDSQKNLNERHLYLLCNLDDNSPIQYNCFKCGEHGYVNKYFLESADIYDTNIASEIYALNKKSKRYDKKGINANDEIYTFNFKIPEIEHSKKTKYINDRFEIDFTLDDYRNMKVVPDLFDFLVLNNIKSSCFKKDALNRLHDHYVGFLSNGNSHILFRDISGKEEHSWVKYPIIKESFNNKIFYSLESTIDIFTRDEINVNLSEGVFDAIGVGYQLLDNMDNSINIAVTGKYYERILQYLLGLGIYGSNVIINVYSDNDNTFNKKKSNDTSIEYYKGKLGKFKNIFKKINVYYNLKDKDYGIPKKDIILQKKSI